MTVYNLNDKNEIVTAMIEHMAQQIENPALRNSKFVFDRILHMDIDFHRLNLTRGSMQLHSASRLVDEKEGNNKPEELRYGMFQVGYNSCNEVGINR